MLNLPVCSVYVLTTILIYYWFIVGEINKNVCVFNLSNIATIFCFCWPLSKSSGESNKYAANVNYDSRVTITRTLLSFPLYSRNRALIRLATGLW